MTSCDVIIIDLCSRNTARKDRRNNSRRNLCGQRVSERGRQGESKGERGKATRGTQGGGEMHPSSSPLSSRAPSFLPSHYFSSFHGSLPPWLRGLRPSVRPSVPPSLRPSVPPSLRPSVPPSLRPSLPPTQLPVAASPSLPLFPCPPAAPPPASCLQAAAASPTPSALRASLTPGTTSVRETCSQTRNAKGCLGRHALRVHLKGAESLHKSMGAASQCNSQ